MKVWKNEKLKWEEHDPAGWVFPRYFEFSQTSMHEYFYNVREH